MSGLTFTVKALNRDYSKCPVFAKVEPGDVPEGAVELLEQASGRAVPAQRLACGDALCLAWIVPSLARGEERHYLLRPAEPTRDAVRLKERPGSVRVSIRGRFFTAYHYGSNWARPFLHPVIGPRGAAVTRGYPMEQVEGETPDHPHHKGCWVAWGDVNGCDNWSDLPRRGSVCHRAFERLEGGPVLGRIVALNDWLNNRGQKLMEERREYRFYDLPAAGRAFDLSVSFRAPGGKVRFGDTKEGGICAIRVASSMEGNRGGVIENSYGGLREAETWGKPAHWCDYSGPVAGATVGVAIMDHPRNLRHPTYWHVRDYGLMTANPFGLHEFFQDESRDGSYELSAGAELTFRYRVFIHRGDARRGKVAARYHHFANPPQIRIDRKPPRLGGISLKSDQLLALDNCGGIHSANRIARQ